MRRLKFAHRYRFDLVFGLAFASSHVAFSIPSIGKPVNHKSITPALPFWVQHPIHNREFPL